MDKEQQTRALRGDSNPLGIPGAEPLFPLNPAAERRGGRSSETENRRLSRALGFGLVAVAIIVVLGNIPWYFSNHNIEVIGVGFWGGFLVLLAAALLLVRAQTAGRRLIKGVVAVCTIALVADICILGNGAFQLTRVDYDSDGDWNASKGIGIVYAWIAIVGFDLLLAAIIQNSIVLIQENPKASSSDRRSPTSADTSDRDNVVVLVQSEDMLREEWNPRTAYGLGIALIIVSVIASVCNIGWFFIDCSLANVGVGFWAGAFNYVTGLLLAFSASKRLRSLVISAMVLAIVAIVFCLGFLAVGGLQVMWSCDTEQLGVGFAVLFVGIGGVSFILLLVTIVLTAINVCGKHRLIAHLPPNYLPHGGPSSLN